jgi:hypothetical protein
LATVRRDDIYAEGREEELFCDGADLHVYSLSNG